MPLILFSTGGPQGLAECLTAGLLAAAGFAFLYGCALSARSGRPSELARAFYAYFLQAIGIILMTISGLPALYGVFMNYTLPHNGYLGLLIVFLVGGIIFLHFEGKSHHTDIQAREVPAAVFRFTLKIIAFFTILIGCLEVLTTLLFSTYPFGIGWWVSPLILIAYGAFITWTTHVQAPRHTHFFSAPMKKTGTVTITKGKIVKKK